jgi:hypothetical protein
MKCALAGFALRFDIFRVLQASNSLHSNLVCNSNLTFLDLNVAKQVRSQMFDKDYDDYGYRHA